MDRAMPGPAWAALDAALAYDEDHDHADAAMHPAAAWDMREVFWSTLPMQDGPPGSLGQLVVKEPYAFVSLNRGGFVVLDVSDPGAPEQVGLLDLDWGYTNDVEVTDDLRWAFLPNTDPGGVNDIDDGYVPDPSAAAWATGGILVVDLADLSDPRVVAVSPPLSTMGHHRVDLLEVDGALHVFSASYDLYGSCHVDILRFDETPAPALVPVGRYTSPDTSEQCVGGPDSLFFCLDVCGVHEVFVTNDPLEGFPIMVAAFWSSGVHLVDVSVPSAPRLLGTWDEMPGYDETVPNVHEAQLTAVEGRRIVAATPEHFWSERQGILWLVDWTEVEAPVLAGTWQVPGTHPFEYDPDRETMQTMSTDAPVLADGRVWLPHHHAGLYVVNISTLELVASPELEAWIMPAGTDDDVGFGGWDATPMVYDVEPRGRTAFVTDINGGFRVIEWTQGAGLAPGT